MAIISIPSSISGVSVPGITSNGPLGLLYSNPYKSDVLHYPRDLNSLTKGHSVQFTVYEVTPVGYEKLKNIISKIPTKEEAINLGENLLEKFGNLKDINFGSILNTVTSAASNLDFESTGLNFQPARNTPIGYIHLYMPDTVDFQYGVSYEDVSATSAAASVGAAVIDKLIPGKNLGKFAEGVTSAVQNGGDIGRLGLQKAGYAVNPQLQVLFQGIGFREFSMNFTFTPYSKDEAQMVEKIIKMFRKNAAPKIVTGAAGMFFVPPSSFGIEFMFNGIENKHLNKIQNSVITGIDVNYAPQGWSAHDDGAPVQTTLSITFKELTLTDSAQIQNGY